MAARYSLSRDQPAAGKRVSLSRSSENYFRRRDRVSDRLVGTVRKTRYELPPEAVISAIRAVHSPPSLPRGIPPALPVPPIPFFRHSLLPVLSSSVYLHLSVFRFLYHRLQAFPFIPLASVQREVRLLLSRVERGTVEVENDQATGVGV